MSVCSIGKRAVFRTPGWRGVVNQMEVEQVSVLIVEDEPIVGMEIEDRLRTMGYGVSGVVATGNEAVAAAADTKPNLVLMDIKLKGDMDGITAADLIGRQNGPPIVYLTANADSATLDRAKLTGPFAFVVKPFDPRDLKIAIEIALYKHEQEAELREAKDEAERALAEVYQTPQHAADLCVVQTRPGQG